jgi:outer membrane protein assembly factor BamB
MKRIVALLTLLALWVNVYSQNNDGMESWKTKLDGAIFATPTVESQTILIGTEKGFLYWIDSKTGTVKHKVKVPKSIRSNAVVKDNRVYIESHGNLYCYKFEDASELFAINNKNNDTTDLFDPWDYFHSTPVYHNGAVYYVSGMGTISVVDAIKGKRLKSIRIPEKTVIRSSLTIEGTILYFGDNKGVIYGYDLNADKQATSFKTLEKIEYENFGAITGGIVVQDGKLFFGSRNTVFSAFDLSSKKAVWSCTDEKGSWWPVSPVVSGNNIVFGGSDNRIVAAHNIETGKEAWRVIVDYNIFCKPLIVDQAIIFGTGDSYSNRAGDGSVYSVNRATGRVVAKYKPGGNVFSSPVENNGNILICTTSGIIESIGKAVLTNIATGDVTIEGAADFLFEDGGRSVAEKELILSNTGNQSVKVSYSFKHTNNALDGAVKVRKDRDQVYGKGNHHLYLQVNRNLLAPGEYLSLLVISISDGINETTIEKPIRIEIKGNAAINEPRVDIEQLRPDRESRSVSMILNVSKKTKVVGKLVSAKDNAPVGDFLYGILDWGIYSMTREIFLQNAAGIAPGKYKLIFDMEGQVSSIDYEVAN